MMEPRATEAVALIDCGAKTLGIAVTHLREVIPEPEVLQPLVSSGPGVVGCVALRGLAVPVVDFAGLLGWPATPEPGILVVLRVEEGIVAFRARATRRIVLSRNLTPQEISHPASGPSEQIFPRHALLDGDVIAHLAPEALTALGIPTTRDTRPSARSTDISDQYLLFELGGRDFALPVARVDGTVPESDVGSPTMISGPCEGAIRRLDLEIPLVNPITMGGMSDGPAPCKCTSAIVLKFGPDHRLALRADRVRDIVQIARSTISPLPRVLARRSDLFLGVVPRGAEPWYHVLDPDKILADPGLQAFASLTRRHGAEAKTGTKAERGRRGTALLFRANGDFALPVEKVLEIIPMPDLPPRYGAHLGTLAHGNGLLPIFDLSQLLLGAASQFTSLSAVIIVQIGGETLGLAAEEMLAIDRVGYVEHPDGRREGMAERREEGRKRSFSVVELDQLAAYFG